MKPLEGKIALVAGATRGAGRGIAVALGEAGATVYCSGRSSRETGTTALNPPSGASASSPPPVAAGRPETIEETAERVTAAGGRGIPARCDHLDEADVRELVERIRREHGHLDVLVNDIWGGEPLVQWGKTFWEADPQKGWRMIETALRTHIITARHAIPLMLGRPGLIVGVTDGDHARYRGEFYYDLVKNAVIHMANALHEEVKDRQLTALAVTPGFLRSEHMLDLFGVTEANWRDAAKKIPDFIASETPLFVGRAIAALAADPAVTKKGGRVWASWTLSDEYGFHDADGTAPHWGRHFEATYGRAWWKPLDDAYYAYLGGIDELRKFPAPDPTT